MQSLQLTAPKVPSQSGAERWAADSGRFPALNPPGMGNSGIVSPCFRECLPSCPSSFALIQLCPFHEEISIFWARFGGDSAVIFLTFTLKKKKKVDWEQLDLLDPKIPACK